ncbi:NAD(P)H oxidoreductase YRKL [Acidisarcina polymorpha]|uniref:NAD(P)H oxidoreductase YRKL n=1 Tax=Acidisarcina polymorpha TaxID=2211140 RepID=A0A2Z5FZV8_9BACT|nr:NAD(P)H-dependent oxidoreductase [Acidisarcina polymorpha]AXC12309.1 NAD(P)H oxidoreductase YRKL [Acidisarcina polymorpha]
MQKNILLVHAQPESTSLTRTLVETAKTHLAASGHRVLESDLYAMQWKAVYDADDFPTRRNDERLSFIEESGYAFSTGTQTSDVQQEQAKLLEADAVLFFFPLWWFGFPAILKGWVDRVFAYGLAYGFRDAGNEYRYGDGGFAGKRAMLAVTLGGPSYDYGSRGINGALEEILFPITHGTLFFTGMEVLPTFAIYGAAHITSEEVASAQLALKKRLDGLFTDIPITFRRQNDGDYPDRHQLAAHVAPGVAGILAHVHDAEGFL